MANISCVLFDLGGVIVNWHNSWLIQDVSDEFQLQKEKLSKEYYKNLPKIATGKINEKELWNIIGKELESKKLMNLNESLLDRIFQKHCSLNNSMINLSKELSQKGITVGILSNTEPASYSAIEKLTSLDHFEYKFLSYNIGYLKPNQEIYRHVIDNVPFLKEELFFIDDLKTNVESARVEGIDSVQYTDYNELLKECQIRNIIL
ncbi:MAG: HAD family phosphatase [Nitrosopumilus sp.]|jgi:HAD superfamily hydrolase (TIGR01509 family)|tara:strand:+ start:597 stop:1211 length:615 start_codon:yes stop_codon:yes gene_type:complete